MEGAGEGQAESKLWGTNVDKMSRSFDCSQVRPRDVAHSDTGRKGEVRDLPLSYPQCIATCRLLSRLLVLPLHVGTSW